MLHRLHVIPNLVLLLISLVVQVHATVLLLSNPKWRSRSRLLVLAIANAAAFTLFVAGYYTSFQRAWRVLPSVWGEWLEACSLASSALLIGVYLGALVWRRGRSFEPKRRAFFRAAACSIAAAPALGIAIGARNRHRIQLSEVDARLPNLPKDLDGLRIVQISDIHLSPFFSEQDLARSIDMANESRAHIALITGDLISRPGDPLDACLRQLGRLRAEAGVLGCLGNHEVYTQTEDYVTQRGARMGIDFLRQRNRRMRFGAASLNFGGVDYQPYHKAYLTGAGSLLDPGSLNVLLSHNPDVFPVAAQQGWDLTIGGHTHGGQVNFEILHQNVDVALYFTPFVRGLYRKRGKSLYVCSGLGTIGVPVRLGAPPEVSLIRLCAS